MQVKEQGNAKVVGRVNAQVSEQVSVPATSSSAWLLWSHPEWYLCLPNPAGLESPGVVRAPFAAFCPFAE